MSACAQRSDSSTRPALYDRLRSQRQAQEFPSMNMSYLDPKIDLVFKRIFSRADLLLDFLNAVLPLDAPIESLTYLPTEQAPQ
ncbi:hypothetical protein D8B22_21455, partial [Verminephrobacter aporrectodeae subsp. tuberculatae]|nr:hypothetical protein [Verminephrobacter aporrectodeae subsp. tuberculatae]MCW8171585.1 hypothetical protein [Verminephrobacter aporrectodeae subsp. tuberculatae]